jgi:uncharacterized membrane protein
LTFFNLTKKIVRRMDFIVFLSLLYVIIGASLICTLGEGDNTKILVKSPKVLMVLLGSLFDQKKKECSLIKIWKVSIKFNDCST